ncbi:type II toxin-antitoxin system RelE/ParE family toxin [Gilvimarinus agarilyticus]|nr:type II toxin-antitoxin system RelE/ParE family toxin [Gilvimarinus agarilyticus]
MLSSTALLGRTPKMGKVEPLLAHKKTEYRFIIVWNYKIIYKLTPKHVTISRVFHTSRNPSNLKGI